MIRRTVAPAQLPPAGISGLDPRWSRLVQVPSTAAIDTNAETRTWHILDSWASKPSETEPQLTLLCVHGNPSWSFLWRELLTQVELASPSQIRVIAVDQLNMGFSERTGVKRTLATRIDDLCSLTHTLGVSGPVVTVAHDWGGPISLGWALRHLECKNPSDTKTAEPSAAKLVGVVLTNTAVHQPTGSPAPSVIRLIRSKLMLKASTVHTGAFIHGAIEMSRPRLPAEVRSGFFAPYKEASRRYAIADFVADIPLDPEHESAATLDNIASGLSELSGIPALLLWGPRDKVFSDLYLHDLEHRLPQANVHRFPLAAHFVTEDADVAGTVVTWLEQQAKNGWTVLDSSNQKGFGQDNNNERASVQDSQSFTAAKDSLIEPSTKRRPLADFSFVEEPTMEAVVELAPSSRSIMFAELTERVNHVAAGMAEFGIGAEDRVAVMIMPGIELSVAVYACWRLGATLVLVDSGLGRKGMQQALHSANPAYLIGIDKALIAAKVLGWPGVRIAVGARSSAQTKALTIATNLQALELLGKGLTPPPYPTPDTQAAIAFTSGATGPSKGVMYCHQQIEAQRDALVSLYTITSEDRLIAAFAPFALYGPTIGITTLVPDMDVTAPSTLTAQALLEAVKRIDATLVFASPAALVNVLATASTLSPEHRLVCESVRLMLSAGAPVRETLLREASSLFNNADLRSPYGMTEVLPVADISLTELTVIAKEQAISGAVAGDGVCVGYPLKSVELAIDPLAANGEPVGEMVLSPGILGEILVRASHARQGYDRLWRTNHQASQPAGWHRTGDVGQLDAKGRLWVGGRLVHIIVTASGVIAPVSVEQHIETLDAVFMAAVVGIGPIGSQVPVAVVQLTTENPTLGGASLALHDEVRSVVSSTIDIASVLIVKKLPVDRRHNSKVDRSAVAIWAAKVLAGERVTML